MTIAHKIATAVAIASLTGCTTAQVTSDAETANKYQSDVQSACQIAETAAAASVIDPNVATATGLIAASCGTESAIASLVLSPTSVAWLNTLITTVKSNGKVVPPAPITAP